MITAVGQVGLGPGAEQHRVDLRVSSEHQSEGGVSMASRVMAQESRVGVRRMQTLNGAARPRSSATGRHRMTGGSQTLIFFCVCVPHLILYTGEPC